MAGNKFSIEDAFGELDRILEQKALDTSVSIADWLPVLPTPTPRLPTMLPAPKLNSAAELKITRDGLDLKVAVSMDLGR